MNQPSSTNDHSLNQDLIWGYFQNDQPESFAVSLGRIRFLVGKLSPCSRVLNIGVGTGFFEQLAIEQGHDVYALDPVPKSIESLQKRFNLGDKAQVGYGQSVPFEDSLFDAVVISEVIEHLSPEVTQATLSEIARVLKPSGKLVGTVPAREDLKLNYVMCPHCGRLSHRWGHQQTFDVEKVRALLSSRFIVETVYERPLDTWSQLNMKGKITHLVKVALWRMGVHGSNEHVFFLARRF